MVVVVRQSGVVVPPAGLVFSLHAAEVLARFENRHADAQLRNAADGEHITAEAPDNAVGAMVDALPKLPVGIDERAGAVDAVWAVAAGRGIGPAQHGAKDADQLLCGNARHQLLQPVQPQEETASSR